MKRTLVFLLSVIVLGGCGDKQALKNVEPKMIWDVYSNLSYDNPEKFLKELETSRKIEYKTLIQTRSSNKSAFDDYIKSLESVLPDDDGNQTLYVPTCFFLPERDKPVTARELYGIYRQDTSVPMPEFPPYTVVGMFVDSASQNRFDEAFFYIEKDSSFDKKIGGLTGLPKFWRTFSEKIKILRIALKEVRIQKGMRDAQVDLDILVFKEPKTGVDFWRFGRIPASFKVYLREDGGWSLLETSL